MLQLIKEHLLPRLSRCCRPSSPSPFRNKTGALLFVSALIIGGLLIPSRFALTLSPSLPYRLFFIGGEKAPVKNGYVLFEGSFPIVGEGTKKAIKKAACVEGETLQVVYKSYYCSGVYMGVAKEQTPSGKKLTNFMYDGQIPKGKLFVTGSHEDSYDSRYFGFIDKKDIKHIVYPII